MREIVAESAIYTRERLVTLNIPSYVFSKFAVLSGIGFAQVLLFVGILVGPSPAHPWHWPEVNDAPAAWFALGSSMISSGNATTFDRV